MTVNKSMLMNVVYVTVILVTVATGWVGLRKKMAISMVAHLASGGNLDARELFAVAVLSRPLIAFN